MNDWFAMAAIKYQTWIRMCLYSIFEPFKILKITELLKILIISKKLTFNS